MSDEITKVFTDKINVGKLAKSLSAGERFDGYSKVIIKVGADENGVDQVFVSGDDSGAVLEIQNEWGTQEMANNILAQVQGWEYQPFESTGTQLSPLAELGDGIIVGSVYSGIYNRSVNYDNSMLANVSAPEEEETIHEYGYDTSTNREFERVKASQKAMISLTSQFVKATVSNDDESFGWNLNSNSWSIFSGNREREIIRATKDGLVIDGKIRSGKLGDDEDGFIITARSIYKGYNLSDDATNSAYKSPPSFSSLENNEEAIGVYIGTDGIRLGRTFSVDSSGNLKATSGDFTGTVRCTALYIQTDEPDENGNVTYENVVGSGTMYKAIQSAQRYAGRESIYDNLKQDTSGNLYINNGVSFRADNLRSASITATGNIDMKPYRASTGEVTITCLNDISPYITGIELNNATNKWGFSLSGEKIYSWSDITNLTSVKDKIEEIASNEAANMMVEQWDGIYSYYIRTEASFDYGKNWYQTYMYVLSTSNLS